MMTFFIGQGEEGSASRKKWAGHILTHEGLLLAVFNFWGRVMRSAKLEKEEK